MITERMLHLDAMPLSGTADKEVDTLLIIRSTGALLSFAARARVAHLPGSVSDAAVSHIEFGSNLKTAHNDDVPPRTEKICNLRVTNCSRARWRLAVMCTDLTEIGTCKQHAPFDTG